MKLGIFTDLNIDKAFRKEVDSLTDDAFKAWVIAIYEPFIIEKYQDIKEDMINHIGDLAIYIDKIDSYIANENKHDKFFLYSLRQLIKTDNQRESIYKALDYLTKYVYQKTKSSDQMVAEKLRHYTLLLK